MSILDAHGLELHRLLVRLTLRADVAADLMQELFLKLADSRGFRQAREPVGYVRRAAINLAFDWRRRRGRGGTDAASAGEPVDPAPPAWMKLARREEIERILAAASELPELSREAFVLRYVHDLDYEQVGKALDRSAHQARGLCHSAVAAIRGRMGVARGGAARHPTLEVFHESS